jgi:hypothetical protein
VVLEEWLYSGLWSQCGTSAVSVVVLNRDLCVVLEKWLCGRASRSVIDT